MGKLRVVRQFLTVVFLACVFSALLTIPVTWATNYPWLSWRHDLQNTGAAPDFGYPIKPKLLWEQTRNNEPPLGTPARCSTPIVVGNDIVFTTGYGGVVEARDQYTGDLIWAKTYTWIPQPPEPPDTPRTGARGLPQTSRPIWASAHTPLTESVLTGAMSVQTRLIIAAAHH